MSDRPRSPLSTFVQGRRAAALQAALEYDRRELTAAMVKSAGVARQAAASLGIAQPRFYIYAAACGLRLSAIREGIKRGVVGSP